VNRIQTLRSSTPGARPVGRQPGELFVNWPDLALGVVDSTSTPVDLIAVRYFSPLTSYAIGEFVVQAGELYRALQAVTPGPFNPAQWTANVMAGDPISGYLPLAGGTLTGTLFGVNASFQGVVQSMREQITNVAGTARSLTGATSLNPRWQMNLGDATPESGANAGSNFSLLAYADDGSTLLSTPLAINRATGAVTLTGPLNGAAATFNGVVTVPGNNSLIINGPAATARAILSQTAGSNRWQLQLGDLSAESGVNVGSNFSLTALSDTGGILSTPLAIERATGNATFGGDLMVNGNLTASGNPDFGLGTVAGQNSLTFGNGWAWEWTIASGDLLWRNAFGGPQWIMRTGSPIDYLAYNPAGPVGGFGPYADISDIRTKRYIASADDVGLTEVLALEPIRFIRLPPAAIGGYSPAERTVPEPRVELGFSAQATALVLPEAVVAIGQEETDPTLAVNSTPIIAVLVNAVKELTARIQVLEAAVTPR
jgi:hypothetical protein